MTASPDGTLLQAARESLLLAARDLLAANRAADAGDLRVAESLVREVEARTGEAKLLLSDALIQEALRKDKHESSHKDHGGARRAPRGG